MTFRWPTVATTRDAPTAFTPASSGGANRSGIVTIAIARELIGACWEIATAP
jgi:hypothetical protein